MIAIALSARRTPFLPSLIISHLELEVYTLGKLGI